MKNRMFISAVLALAALAFATTAVAGTVTATGTVSGAGAMSLTHGTTASFTDTLDGTDQTVAYTLPLTVTDARGTGAGWNLTVTSTLFSDGAGHTLAATASQIASVAMACNGGATCSNPTNAIAFPLTVPAAASAPAAVKLFNSAATTGMGGFTITPTVNVRIPGNSYAGTYSSTVTVAAVSGP
jgi:hypothetical protein